jgi:hypothetical protein
MEVCGTSLRWSDGVGKCLIHDELYRDIYRSNDSSRILWCLVEGESDPFAVTVSAGETISQLKKAVHSEKDKGLFRDVNVVNLDLLVLKASKF